MSRKTRGSGRRKVLGELARVGREHSDATVLFHATIANLLELDATAYKALGILERLGPMSAGEIAERCGLATASVTNLVDRLEDRGLVRRVRDAVDRRRVIVEPVVDRVTATGGLFASTQESLKRLYARYSDEELAVIADFLHANAERLHAETLKLHGASAPALFAAGEAGPAAVADARARR